MTAKFVCIRFYPDMTAKYTVRDQAGMESWKEYNRTARGGNSLFINGEYVPTTGMIKGKQLEQVAAFCKEIQSVYEAKPIEMPGPQVETFGGYTDRYHGWGEEKPVAIPAETRRRLYSQRSNA